MKTYHKQNMVPPIPTRMGRVILEISKKAFLVTAVLMADTAEFAHHTAAAEIIPTAAACPDMA